MRCIDCDDLTTCQEQCADFCTEMFIDEDDDDVSRFGVGVNDKEDWPSFIQDEFTGVTKYVVFEIAKVGEDYNLSVFRRLN